jgi:UDP-glucose 6-dehydrogenase
MDIVIFGKGFVGKATAAIFSDNVAWHDPPQDIIIDDFSTFKHAIISVPTPSTGAGLDHSIIEQCLETLSNSSFTGIKIIRSTCEPKMLQEFNEKYGNVIFWPEFLRERHAVEDAVNPKQVVLGGDMKQIMQWRTVLIGVGHGSNVGWTLTDLVTASMIKIGLNTALSAKIMMFNAIYAACAAYGADFNTVRLGVGADPRIGTGQSMVPGPDSQLGFGGKCLPKDSNSFGSMMPEDLFIQGLIAQNLKVRNGDLD